MFSNSIAPKDLVKRFIWNTCGPSLQHKLRCVHTVRQIKKNRYFREPEMDLIRRFVKSGDRVADLGANVGVYTREFSLAAGSEGRVYAFEPVVENYDILTTLVRKLRLDNVTTFRAAIGSQTAESEMVIPEMKDFRGFYWAHLAGSEDPGRREKVSIFALDDLFKLKVIEDINFIKCDVEGSELEVLEGSVDLVNGCRPTWLMEVSRKTSFAVFSLFNQLGYDAFVYSTDLVPVKGYRDGEFSNYLFRHRNEK